MKKRYLALLVLLSSTFLLTGCIWEPGRGDFRRYLKKKYPDEKMMIIKKEDCNNWMRECKAEARDKKNRVDFTVYASWDQFGKNKSYDDDYLEQRYASDIENYFENLIKPVVGSNFDHLYIDYEDHFNTPDTNATFEEVLRYDKANFEFTIKLKYETDYDSLKNRIVNVLNNNNFKNVYRIDIKQKDCYSDNGCSHIYEINPSKSNY